VTKIYGYGLNERERWKGSKLQDSTSKIQITSKNQAPVRVRDLWTQVANVWRGLGEFQVLGGRTVSKAVSLPPQSKTLARGRWARELPLKWKIAGDFPIRLETRNGGLCFGDSRLDEVESHNFTYFQIRKKFCVSDNAASGIKVRQPRKIQVPRSKPQKCRIGNCQSPVGFQRQRGRGSDRRSAARRGLRALPGWGIKRETQCPARRAQSGVGGYPGLTRVKN